VDDPGGLVTVVDTGTDTATGRIPVWTSTVERFLNLLLKDVVARWRTCR
jgi:hypothetical protein